MSSAPLDWFTHALDATWLSGSRLNCRFVLAGQSQPPDSCPRAGPPHGRRCKCRWECPCRGQLPTAPRQMSLLWVPSRHGHSPSVLGRHRQHHVGNRRQAQTPRVPTRREPRPPVPTRRHLTESSAPTRQEPTPRRPQPQLTDTSGTDTSGAGAVPTVRTLGSSATRERVRVGDRGQRCGRRVPPAASLLATRSRLRQPAPVLLQSVGADRASTRASAQTRLAHRRTWSDDRHVKAIAVAAIHEPFTGIPEDTQMPTRRGRRLAPAGETEPRGESRRSRVVVSVAARRRRAVRRR